MDEIVNLVAEKTGLSAEKAQEAVTLVLDQLKDKVPALAGPLESFRSGGGSGLADVAGKLGGLGDMFKK